MEKTARYPEWKKRVDSDMRKYLVWERVIKQQENIIMEHRLSGMRTTPVYELREGSGGTTENQAEKIVQDIEFAETKIAAGRKYRADLEETARMAAGNDPAKLLFIQRYWWTNLNIGRRGRIMLVLDALHFLAHREWGTGRPTRANSNFYTWRDQIYEALGELLGYR